MKQITKKSFLFLFFCLAIVACGDDEEPNTAPSISAQSFNASEGITDGDVIGIVTASDEQGDALTFSISSNDNNLFTITAGDATTTGGQLGLNTGQNLDFETATTHSIVVSVSDGQLTTTATITINVIDVDENTMPTIAAQTFTAAEDISDTAPIGTVAAADAEGDALTFSITGNSDDLFEITTAGEISLAAGANLDFETTTSHDITVTVSDGSLTASATITINVTDVAENTAPAIANQTFTVAEDIDPNTTIGTITATDAEGDNISFSITANDNGLFRLIDGGDLRLATNQSLDFETATSHSITVEATDGGLSNTATITIEVTDVDESNPAASYTVSTLAGGTQGFLDGQGESAQFNSPNGVAVDADGNVYVADSGNKRIRKIDTNGNVTTIAGTGAEGNNDGAGSQATFTFPDRLDVDNGTVYVSDTETIRVIDNSLNVTTLTGKISTRDDPTVYRDGALNVARFSNIKGITRDNAGNIFVADEGNHRIRKIDTNGNVTTFAGGGQGNADGNGTSARFRNPKGVAVDANGNVFVVDSSNDRIRRIDPSGNVTTFAGTRENFADGQGTDAAFNTPTGIAIDSEGNLYITDTNNVAIRKIDPDGNVITIAGARGAGVGDVDGTGDVAQFDLATGIAVDANGNIYVADPRNHKIRKIVFNQ
ncbi:cadherin domain-containing protein [Roseivirga sp.]|uniref:NHL domain-containing protein n=1 Tax=Roseivirga sp. TaxID=1964215 RepID=UPI003B8DD0E2